MVCSAAASAAPPTRGGTIQEQFVNFGDQLIDGHIKKPQATVVNQKERAKFGRMLTWKKRSFLPQLALDGRSLK